MKASVRWVDGMMFEASADSGHTIVMDGPPELGGRNRGSRPMEVVLMGAGACSAADVVSILGKSRQDVTDCVVELEAERAGSVPKVFTSIHMHYVVSGRGLKPEAVERAVRLSAEKYCSATRMLNETAAITHDFEIRGA
ncbi:MAG: OsmC family protein [Gammaproteobacteria bacterium]|nr:OsmC family protein [Gammaproteobacteria bacterium]